MLFSKKRREEKKELKRQQELKEQKEKEIAEELNQAEEQTKAVEQVLTKDIEVEADERTLLKKFKIGLKKTKRLFLGGLMEESSDDPLDDDFIEDLEEQLLAADIGVVTTTKIIERIEKKWADLEIETQKQAIEELKKIVTSILDKGNQEIPPAESGPTVLLFVGVNGVGKTTSIGKIAAKYQRAGKKVLVAAGDTFRAAAIEQLEEWTKRAQVDFVRKEVHSDPSATIYEAAEKAVSGGYDVLLCDTSGRLHTKKNLMEELKKIQRVVQKVIPSAPHASLLVLDANTGQNAIVQTKEFGELIGLDGLIVTKLDGTAKGGVIIGIVNEFDIPIQFIGVGEGIDDLQPFDARLFAESLFD